MAGYLLEIAENGRHLCIRRGLVVVEENSKTLGEVPIDSLASVVLSGHGISLSKNFLVAMAENNIPVIICDSKYLPISTVLPNTKHYKSLPIVKAQMDVSAVLQKQIWKNIISVKIYNQSCLLEKLNKDSHVCKQVKLLSQKVSSGDSDNKEGQAARLYWPALMGKGFIRHQEGSGVNIFLNYGYAVVRASCARAICGAGLLPLLGIHHHNVYNACALADDMMEPLRPFVDELVYSCNVSSTVNKLEPKDKKILAQILSTPLPFCGEEHNLASIASRMAFGLAKCFTQKDASLLPLPKML